MLYKMDTETSSSWDTSDDYSSLDSDDESQMKSENAIKTWKRLQLGNYKVDSKTRQTVNKMILDTTGFDLGRYIGQKKNALSEEQLALMENKINIVYHKILMDPNNWPQVQKYFKKELDGITIPSQQFIGCLAENTKKKIESKLDDLGKTLLTGSHWRYFDTISSTASSYFISIWFNIMFHHKACVLLASPKQTSMISWRCEKGKRVLMIAADLERDLARCLKNPQIKFIIISVGLYNTGCPQGSGGHANCLVIDKDNWTVFRFEPNGYGSLMDRLRKKWSFAKKDADLSKEGLDSKIQLWNVGKEITSILNYNWLEQNGKNLGLYVQSFLEDEEDLLPQKMIEDVESAERRNRYKLNHQQFSPPQNKLYTGLDLKSDQWFDTYSLDVKLREFFTNVFGLRYVSPFATVTINSSLVNYSVKKNYDPDGFCQTINWMFMFLLLFRNNSDYNPSLIMSKWAHYLEENFEKGPSQIKVKAEEDTQSYESSTQAQIFLRNLVILLNQYYYKFISDILERHFKRAEILIYVKSADKNRVSKVLETFAKTHIQLDIDYRPKNWVKKYYMQGNSGMMYTASPGYIYTWLSCPLTTPLSLFDPLVEELINERLIARSKYFGTGSEKSGRTFLDYRSDMNIGKITPFDQHSQLRFIPNNYIIDLRDPKLNSKIATFKIKQLYLEYLVYADYDKGSWGLYYGPISKITFTLGGKSVETMNVDPEKVKKMSTVNYYNIANPTDDHKVQELLRWTLISQFKHMDQRRAISFTGKELNRINQIGKTRIGKSVLEYIDKCKIFL